MTSRTTVRAGLTVVAALVASTIAAGLPASAEPPAQEATATADAQGGVRGPAGAGFRAAVDARLGTAAEGGTSTSKGSTPKAAVKASAVIPLPAMSTVCGTGAGVDTVLHVASFETNALPYPDLSSNFVVQKGRGGVGSYSAYSRMLPDPDDVGLLTTNQVNKPPARSYLTFLYKGSWLQDDVEQGGAVFVNNTSTLTLLNATTTWTRVYLDVTSLTSSGLLDVTFALLPAMQRTNAVTLEVDDARLYSCYPPNAKVRGDWTGEGTVDVLGVTSTGDLYLYGGKGNGTVVSGEKIGSGWTGTTWLGSPGDVTGDGRTDLLQRRTNGTLWLYPGAGDSAFASGRQVGSGWGGFTSLATPGDMNLDGKPDLLARKADGTLHLYNFTGNAGALAYAKQVGSGWQGMNFIVGIGDLNKDRRGDVVGVRSADNCFYAYTTTTKAGLASGKKVGCGWGTMNVITSPGDLDKDGLGDVLARNDAGQLWFYPGRAGGGVRSGKQVGSGWSGIANIL